MGDQLEEEGDLAAAESHYREAVEIYGRKLAPCQRRRVSGEIGLLRVLRKQGKLDEMERLLTDFHAEVDRAGPDASCRGEYLKSFVRLDEEKDKANPGQGFDQAAAEWQEKLAEWRATTQPAKP